MKFLNKKFLGILISIVFIGIIVHQIDINKTISSFSLMNPVYILPIIPVYFLSFAMRAFRWRIFLCNKDLKFTSLLSSIFIGFSLNCVLPARAGEIYRAYFFSNKENLDKTRVFTSVILERIFDGVMLFLMLVAAICLIHPGELFSKIALSAGLIFLGGFVMLLVLAKTRGSGDKRERIKLFMLKISKKIPAKIGGVVEKMINKIFLILSSFIEGLKSLDSAQLLAKAVFYSLMVWLMEGSFMLLVIKSFGLEATFLMAVLALTVTAFSTLIPAGPAGIGPYQWGYVIALGVFGVEKELGFAISIINQVLFITLILSAGLFFGWRDHLNFSELKQKLAEKETSQV